MCIPTAPQRKGTPFTFNKKAGYVSRPSNKNKTSILPPTGPHLNKVLNKKVTVEIEKLPLLSEPAPPPTATTGMQFLVAARRKSKLVVDHPNAGRPAAAVKEISPSSLSQKDLLLNSLRIVKTAPAAKNVARNFPSFTARSFYKSTEKTADHHQASRSNILSISSSSTSSGSNCIKTVSSSVPSISVSCTNNISAKAKTKADLSSPLRLDNNSDSNSLPPPATPLDIGATAVGGRCDESSAKNAVAADDTRDGNL